VINEIVVQFAGFKAKGAVREYTFTVREQATEPREFTLTIPIIAFDERITILLTRNWPITKAHMRRGHRRIHFRGRLRRITNGRARKSRV
jgi:hypothetical protein